MRIAESDVMLDVPIGYAPRSTLLPPPPREAPSSVPAPLTPFVDALGQTFHMEMDWSDRANDDAPASSGTYAVRPASVSWGPERPTKPSPSW